MGVTGKPSDTILNGEVMGYILFYFNEATHLKWSLLVTKIIEQSLGEIQEKTQNN